MIRGAAGAFLSFLLWAGPAAAPFAATVQSDEGSREQSARNTIILGCWGDADNGDDAELKLAFLGNGSLVQYDETQQERRRRTFGAWEMQKDSTFLVVYWPNGSITRYTVKRIGPILHFAGMFGVRNFTLRQIRSRSCWEPKE
jgi:hypothetical protein